ncbi:hypothetical protein [Planctomicrobium sp. SH527]|uniref:hypothetical protein n=1 Tax=Planctomicrobium sp. SH527 TaxID=3448123 RepID=UPI003F5C0B14
MQSNVSVGIQKLASDEVLLISETTQHERHTPLQEKFAMPRGRTWFLYIGLCCSFLLSNILSSELHAQASPPRPYSSKTFQVMTDLPPDKAKELLENLESMIKLVSEYFGRPCRKPIKMYVVDNLANWPADELQKFDQGGLAKIRNGEGLTVTSTLSIIGGPRVDADAIVYAVSDRGTAQHEAIHAYCGVTFGGLGPVWYSEGMAEVGQYWRAGEKGVNTRIEVLNYLKSETPRPVMEIVDRPLEETGDSWQNYAWRWAICHMLGTNENYSQRFKPLGMALLNGNQASFRSVYGSQVPEIEFEFRQFMLDLEPGYRSDLCSWDWKSKFKTLAGSTQAVVKVQSARGWQASRVQVKSGTTYEINCTGEWTLGDDQPSVTVAGGTEGRGKLTGVVMADYQLGEPFEIGDSTSFTATEDGNLYLRCRDDWGAIADNKGTVSIRIKRVK